MTKQTTKADFLDCPECGTPQTRGAQWVKFEYGWTICCDNNQCERAFWRITRPQAEASWNYRESKGRQKSKSPPTSKVSATR